MRTGRPKEDIYQKYVAGHEETITSDCRNGADNAGLALRLGCGLTTLKRLIRDYPEFKKLVRINKYDADLKVESSLYNRALGYEVEETTTKVIVNKDGTGTTTEVSKTKKHIVADTTACIFWMKNRKPEEWREKQEVEVSGNPFEELMKAATAK